MPIAKKSNPGSEAVKPEIVLNANLNEASVALLEEHYTCHKLYDADDRAGFLDGVKDNVRALVTSGFRGFDRALVEALPNLEMISIWGAGLQAADLDVVKEKGIILSNTPDDSRIAVADLAMALLMSVARQCAEGDKFVKSGRWASEVFDEQGIGLYKKKCGIIALGTIGRAVAKRAAAFDMDIAYFGPNKKADADYRYYDDLLAMATDSDFLMVCCPEMPETIGLVTGEVIRALGPDGIVVNVGRGICMDEAGLIKALQDKAIAGAGLDVYQTEPSIPKALRKCENAVLVPHVGTATRDIRNIRRDMCLKNLQAFFAGEPVLAPVYVPE
ncbi:MAG: hydroxyacid dehydrogenase [Rhodospirillaceae bacterium]|nr:hydroxyacid dehydrogenase [Rhodospirillaceae bacterium]